ncbi:MAG: hypothetical protein AB1324_06315 [Candidatus Micrarchaeota archaeon]
MQNKEEINELIRSGICPNCKNRLAHKEGCVECEFCGWSICEES